MEHRADLKNLAHLKQHMKDLQDAPLFSKLSDVRTLNENFAKTAMRDYKNMVDKVHFIQYSIDPNTDERLFSGAFIAEHLLGRVDEINKVVAQALKEIVGSFRSLVRESSLHAAARLSEEAVDNAVRNVLPKEAQNFAGEFESLVGNMLNAGRKTNEIIASLISKAAHYGVILSEDIARAFIETTIIKQGLLGTLAHLGLRGVKG